MEIYINQRIKPRSQYIIRILNKQKFSYTNAANR